MNEMDRNEAYELTDAEREWFQISGVRAEFGADLKKKLKAYQMDNQPYEEHKKAKRVWNPLNGAPFPRRMQSGFASGIISIALILGLVSGVVYAVGKYTGYIPGFGTIDQGAPVQVLSATQSRSRDGIELNIISAISSIENTAIVYSLKGIPPNTFEGNASLNPEIRRCESGAWLELPNGEQMSSIGYGSLGYDEDQAYQKVVFFAPLPEKTKEFSFRLDCIEGTYPGGAPEDWSIGVTLEEATDLQAFPILKSQSNSDEQPKNSIAISDLIPVEDKFIILGRYIPGFEGVSDLSLKDVTFLDAKGNHLSYNIPGDFQFYSNDGEGGFAYIVEATPLNFPITLQISQISFLCWGKGPITIPMNDVPADSKDYEVRQSVNVGSCQVELVSLRDSGRKLTLRFAADGHKINYVSVRDANDPEGEVTSNKIKGQAFVEISPKGLMSNQQVSLTVEGVELESIDPVSAVIELQDFQ